MSEELEAIIQRMNELEEQKDDVEGMIQALNSDLEDISIEMASVRQLIRQIEERIANQEWEDNNEEENTETDIQAD